MASVHATSNGRQNPTVLSDSTKIAPATHADRGLNQNGNGADPVTVKEDRAKPVIRVARRRLGKKLGVGIIGCGY